MLTDNAGYHYLGGDYFTKHEPERAIRRINGQTNVPSLTVHVYPIRDAPPFRSHQFLSTQS